MNNVGAAIVAVITLGLPWLAFVDISWMFVSIFWWGGVMGFMIGHNIGKHGRT